jgi:hypothetical protein
VQIFLKTVDVLSQGTENPDESFSDSSDASEKDENVDCYSTVDDNKPHGTASAEVGFNADEGFMGTSSEMEGNCSFGHGCCEVDTDNWKLVDDGENNNQQSDCDADDTEESVPDIR